MLKKSKGSVDYWDDQNGYGPMVTIHNNQDKLYIDTGRDRVILEPNFSKMEVFTVDPIDQAEFFYEVSQHVDLIQIYKKLYKKQYHENWDKRHGRKTNSSEIRKKLGVK